MFEFFLDVVIGIMYFALASFSMEIDQMILRSSIVYLNSTLLYKSSRIVEKTKVANIKISYTNVFPFEKIHYPEL